MRPTFRCSRDTRPNSAHLPNIEVAISRRSPPRAPLVVARPRSRSSRAPPDKRKPTRGEARSRVDRARTLANEKTRKRSRADFRQIAGRTIRSIDRVIALFQETRHRLAVTMREHRRDGSIDPRDHVSAVYRGKLTLLRGKILGKIVHREAKGANPCLRWLIFVVFLRV